MYALPTREEMTALKETAAMFRSNIFKMQLDATLAESRMTERAAAAVEAALHDLKAAIDAAPEDARAAEVRARGAWGIALPAGVSPPRTVGRCVQIDPDSARLPRGVVPPLAVGQGLGPVHFQFLRPAAGS